MGSSRQRDIREVGTAAPDFRLPRLDGGEFSLGEQRARGPVWLAFFKGSCPVCQLTLRILSRIQAGQKDGALSLFAVSQDDAEDTRGFNRHFKVALPTLLDSED